MYRHSFFCFLYIFFIKYALFDASGITLSDYFASTSSFTNYIYDSSESYQVHDVRVDVDEAEFQWVLLGQERDCKIKVDNSPWLNGVISLQGKSSRFRPLPKKQYELLIETDDGESHDLVFRHSYRDPAYSREKLAHELVRSSGGIAIQVNHVNMYINGNYNGLYQMAESIDSSMVEKNLGSNADLWYYIKRVYDISVRSPSGILGKTDTEDVLEFNPDGDANEFSGFSTANILPLYRASNASVPAGDVANLTSLIAFMFSKRLMLITDVQVHNFYLLVDPATDLLHPVLWDADKLLGLSETEGLSIYDRSLYKSITVLKRELLPGGENQEGPRPQEFDTYKETVMDLLSDGGRISNASIHDAVQTIKTALAPSAARDAQKWSRWYCSARLNFDDAMDRMENVIQKRAYNLLQLLENSDDHDVDVRDIDQKEGFFYDKYECDFLHYGKGDEAMYALLYTVFVINVLAALVPDFINGRFMFRQQSQQNSKGKGKAGGKATNQAVAVAVAEESSGGSEGGLEGEGEVSTWQALRRKSQRAFLKVKTLNGRITNEQQGPPSSSSSVENYFYGCYERLFTFDYWLNVLVSLLVLVAYVIYARYDVLDDSEILNKEYMSDLKYVWIYFAIAINLCFLVRDNTFRVLTWVVLVLSTNIYSIIDLIEFAGAESNEETTVNSRGVSISVDNTDSPIVFVLFMIWRVGVQVVMVAYSLRIPQLSRVITMQLDEQDRKKGMVKGRAPGLPTLPSTYGTAGANASGSGSAMEESGHSHTHSRIHHTRKLGQEEGKGGNDSNENGGGDDGDGDGDGDGYCPGEEKGGDNSLGNTSFNIKLAAIEAEADAEVEAEEEDGEFEAGMGRGGESVVRPADVSLIEKGRVKEKKEKKEKKPPLRGKELKQYRNKMKRFMQINMAVFILICVGYVIYLAIEGTLAKTAGEVFFSTVISVVILINIRAFYSCGKWFWLHAYGFDTDTLDLMFGSREDEHTWSLDEIKALPLQARETPLSFLLPGRNLSTEKKIRTVDGWTKKIAHTYDGLLVFILSAESFSEGGDSSETYSLAYSISLLYMLLYVATYKKDGPLAWIIYGAKARVMDGFLGRENEIFGYMFDKYMLPVSAPLLLWLQDQAGDKEVVYLSWYVFMPVIIGDSFAELVGATWGKQKIKVWGMGEINKKSWEGTIAMFLSSFLILVGVNIAVGLGWPWYLFAFVNCIVATLVELYAYRSTDNVCMMLFSSLLAVAFINMK